MTIQGFCVFYCILGLAMSPKAEAQTAGFMPSDSAAYSRFIHARARKPIPYPLRVPRAAVAASLPAPFSAPTPMQNLVNFIPATEAFNNSPVCSASDLDNDHDEARLNPEWKAVNGLNIDPANPVLNDPPTILEGFVPFPPNPEGVNDQSTSEVSEEDIGWNHFTHDFTFKVAPDAPYQHLLSSWKRFPGLSFPIDSTNADISLCFSEGGVPTNGKCVVPPETCPDGSTGETCHHSEMEVEWENASLMDEGEGFQRIWGAVPEFVWPGAGDRVWVSGRWIFDCGHPGVPKAAAIKDFVKYGTEIHPPRALATIRINHPALDSFPRPRVSAPNFPGPQSFLPVTGEPVTLPPDVPNSGPTGVAVTEADIFVSGNGGGANDLCMILALDDDDCKLGHSKTVIPVNSQNYVFDIYPPATDYLHTEENGTFRIFPPTADASLQWRTVDHFSELPRHACGGNDNSVCVTVEPILCLIDAQTPPPDQTETACPAVPAARPTRLRVILPFAGSSANYFARSILLGWDDVPFVGSINQIVRNFKITLHKFTVVENGEFFHGSDWRVFVNVAGQYRYIDPFFDRNPDGSNKCHGDALTDDGDDDCFLFDETPWFVSVQNSAPIHVGVGGWESDAVDSDFCRKFPPDGDCDPFGTIDLIDLATQNNDRIGTFEFDLRSSRNYQWVTSDGTPITSQTTDETSDGESYRVEFRVEEIPQPAPPVSDPIQLGNPHFGNFISSATPVTLSSTSAGVEGFQYRSYPPGGPLPVYPSPQPFPVHWTHVSLQGGSPSAPVFLTGADGPNLLQFSAQSNANLLEPRHTETLNLDNTPPVIDIVQPQPVAYNHSDVLTLDYLVTDGDGSGLASFTPTMDGATTLKGGIGLQSGQPIRLLTELKLGTHTFNVTATDNVGNTSNKAVTFTIVVTAASILEDVRQFFQDGAIRNDGIENSLLAKLNNAADDQAAGRCARAANSYQAFINELQAQSGKGVDADAASVMMDDANYLISHCP